MNEYEYVLAIGKWTSKIGAKIFLRSIQKGSWYDRIALRAWH